MVLNFVAPFNLFPQDILLIEEQDKIRVQQKSCGPHLFEQIDRLLELVFATFVIYCVETRTID